MVNLIMAALFSMALAGIQAGVCDEGTDLRYWKLCEGGFCKRPNNTCEVTDMSKRKKAGKSCHKVEYPTKEAARTALNEYGKARGARRYYRCNHHGNREVWHLTSQER